MSFLDSAWYNVYEHIGGIQNYSFTFNVNDGEVDYFVTYPGDADIYPVDYPYTDSTKTAFTVDGNTPAGSIIVAQRVSEKEQSYNPEERNRIISQDIASGLDDLQAQITENFGAFDVYGVRFEDGTLTSVDPSKKIERAGKLLAFDLNGEYVITSLLPQDLEDIYDQIEAWYNQIEIWYNDIQSDYDQIQIWYNQIETWYNDFNTKYTDFINKYNDFITKYDDFITKYNDFNTKYNDFLTKYGQVETWYNQIEVWYNQIAIWYPEIETFRDEAEAARDKAQEWAENPEDVEVEPGKYSALHWAEKAKEEAESIIPPTGLEQVTEGGKTGYRLVGKDPLLYANTGEQAIDMSNSTGSEGQVGAQGDASAILGGTNNNITSSAVNSVIANGIRNSIRQKNSFIGSGSDNIITGQQSAILAGRKCEVRNNFSFVIGGEDNIVNGQKSSIVSGQDNINDGAFSILGGGRLNQVLSGSYTGLISGYQNTIAGDYSYIGGGELNDIVGDYSIIAGGNRSTVNGFYSTVCGGENHTISNDFAFIGGGKGCSAEAGYSTVAGGNSNTASGFDSTVGGGEANVASGLASTVSGGENNIANNNKTVVSGGEDNIAGGSLSAIGGGSGNTANGTGATIAGGVLHNATSSFTSIGGGRNNTTNGTFATVSGGEDNTASNSFATVVGGKLNIASGIASTVTGGRNANAYIDYSRAFARDTIGQKLEYVFSANNASASSTILSQEDLVRTGYRGKVTIECVIIDNTIGYMYTAEVKGYMNANTWVETSRVEDSNDPSFMPSINVYSLGFPGTLIIEKPVTSATCNAFGEVKYLECFEL